MRRTCSFRRVRRGARLNTVLWLACAASLLAACSYGGPAPVFDRSYGNREPAQTSEPGIHIVQAGETVYGIAQRYGVSTRALIDANTLGPPYRLSVGDRLRVPAAQAHVVQRGDTLYGISRRYDIDMASLARANQLRPPYVIRVGQRLALPIDATPGATPTAQLASAAPDSSPVTVTPLAAPAAGPPGVSKIGAHPPGTPRPKPAFRPMPSVPPRDHGGFVWPVDGRVVSVFGAKSAGLHNDGLNIAAPRGAPVRAADNGVVAYAGNQIRGFGNMILIKHQGGLITAYAHADTLLVSRGDVVSRGQVVARVGSSGGVPAPQLHFEVRQGSRAVDPRKYLPS